MGNESECKNRKSLVQIYVIVPVVATLHIKDSFFQELALVNGVNTQALAATYYGKVLLSLLLLCALCKLL